MLTWSSDPAKRGPTLAEAKLCRAVARAVQVLALKRDRLYAAMCRLEAAHGGPWLCALVRHTLPAPYPGFADYLGEPPPPPREPHEQDADGDGQDP